MHSHSDSDVNFIFRGTKKETDGRVVLSQNAAALREAMKAAFGDPRIVYHGTKSHFVQPILDNGFRNAGVANYGPGIYFAKTKEHAASYGTSIFECEVFGTARTRSKRDFQSSLVDRELKAYGVEKSGQDHESCSPASESSTYVEVSDGVVVVEDNLAIFPIKVHAPESTGNAGGRPRLMRSHNILE